MKRGYLFLLLAVGVVQIAACGGSSSAFAPPGLAGADVRRLGGGVLYSFQGGGSDGQNPYSGLLSGGGGEFYGTTFAGGFPSGGAGTVYDISAAGKEAVLYKFRGTPDGAGPQAPLIEDASGALYGTTDYGGNAPSCTYGCGTVFKLTPGTSGFTESVLYTFVGGNDGSGPHAGLLMTKSGALFGTTVQGGGACAQPGCGTVFELKPSGSNYSESVLHAFSGMGGDGMGPAAALVADAGGNLYGTTLWGGSATPACRNGPFGVTTCGTVFKLTPSGSTYTLSIIYRFKGGADGKYPESSLFPAAHGAYYGLTNQGGATFGNGYGTVFELTPKGSSYTEHVLYAFKGGMDGSDPDDSPGLVADRSGNLYGTTVNGGTSACAGGCGTIFKLTHSGSGFTESVVYRFLGGADGQFPYGGVAFTKKGTVIGPTWIGGTGSCSGPSGSGCGTIFSATR
ncbi:MAG: hypothetical protein JO190_08330 [Candidatus Eremiobacteraeota bacterium]|nr:hypothetical protein [Candidatus Eremiobacteraeota bacterium]